MSRLAHFDLGPASGDPWETWTFDTAYGLFRWLRTRDSEFDPKQIWLSDTDWFFEANSTKVHLFEAMVFYVMGQPPEPPPVNAQLMLRIFGQPAGGPGGVTDVAPYAPDCCRSGPGAPYFLDSGGGWAAFARLSWKVRPAIGDRFRFGLEASTDAGAFGINTHPAHTALTIWEES